ncbi:MAG: MoaD/ThiS family protein [Dehalococcoidia bacterium]|nr:MoaD/ThiS family protein [Dehalococcoidia bacterium]
MYLNNTEIHDLDGIETAVQDGDQIAVIPALAGGR